MADTSISGARVARELDALELFECSAPDALAQDETDGYQPRRLSL